MALRIDENRPPLRVLAGGGTLQKPAVKWIPSPNFSSRPGGPADIDTIVIHHTSSSASAESIGQYFQNPSSKVSAQYTIGKDGTIVQSVPDGKSAWHAGKSSFKGRSGVNGFSLGIELWIVGNGKDPFTAPQYESLANLVAWMMQTYKVPMERITGHKDIALPRGRKDDPAINFDYDLLRKMVQERLKGSAPASKPVTVAPPRPAPLPSPPQEPRSFPPVPPRPAPVPQAPPFPSPWPVAGPTLPPGVGPAPGARPQASVADLLGQLHSLLDPQSPTAPPTGLTGSAGSGPLLADGSRGAAVSALQSRLKQLGCDPGEVDGIFGPLTEAAVVAFQQSRNIAVEGVVGPETWGQLGIQVA